VWVDGKNSASYNHAWAASNVFVSLSDNLQETFGITPVEAMASGLPVLVADWNGYKDTVVEGVTGFRIPTWMPPPDVGMALASAFEAGTINYDHYIGLACMEVSVDHARLIERLVELIQSPELRERLGSAGKDRVCKVYDWSIVMDQYCALLKELNGERLKAQTELASKLKSAPRCAPGRQDPYRVFASFPTQMIGPATVIGRSQLPWDASAWETLMQDPLFAYAQDFLPKAQHVQRVLHHLGNDNLSVAELAEKIHLPVAPVIKWIASMAKLGLVSLAAEPSNVNSSTSRI
jgi:hypothetical protein